MTGVELVLTDTRLWARSEATHWDGPPSIVPASDGASFVVGEALRPQYPAVSVVRLADADRIAFPTLPTLADAFAVLFGAVLTNLHLPGPCERLTVLAPSDWGRRRRAAVQAAATRLVADTTVEPLALRAVSLGASTAQHQRIAVLEANPLSTTVTLVGRSGTDIWIDACEHEPTVGLADGPNGFDGIGAVVARLLAGQTPTYLLAVGISEPGLLEGLRAAIAGQCGFPVDVRPIGGAELIHGAHPPVAASGMPYRPAAEAQPDRESSLREYALAAQPPQPRRNRFLLAAAATVVVVIAAAVGVIVLLTGSSDETTTAAQSSAPPAPKASAAPSPQVFGRVRTQIPAGWHIASQTDARVDLAPDGGARQRITLTQKPLAPGATADDVAHSLESQIQRRPPGTVTELRRDPSFGGRPGLSYEEYPPDGTTVRWQVLVDSGVQVSIGCQYPSGSWQPLAPTCEQFVHDARITPQ
ncbi:type VII secretion-associated protein (TIGR03931 family) [Nocardia transvalensis]|uniref:Type VII secretion-associated protein (TIGR03931 family) n=1 Tax=Nocardia transvalensis TaxID=37333 RepID=A0A7W9PB62_9NOCA|nr:type VII secretion-associated protein [Nocardia transvalensis]MBB5912801.1 type VII secretion-associated protein (TIGR03931 family) [Nocardia transvalensis]